MARDKKTARKSAAARATSRSTSSSSGSVTALVLLDSYRWYDEHGDTSSEVQEAFKGDEVTVSAAEFDRSQKMTPPGLAKTGSDEAKVATGDLPAPEPPLTKPDGEPVEPVEADDQ